MISTRNCLIKLIFAYVVVVDEASFESSSLTSVTGTSLVSMMFVEEMDELRKRLTMWADSLAALPPATGPRPLPPAPSVRLAFVVLSRVGGSVIGTLRVVVGSAVVVVVVGTVVVLRLIHGGSGRSVVVVVVETERGRNVVNLSINCSTEWLSRILTGKWRNFPVKLPLGQPSRPHQITVSAERSPLNDPWP